MIKVVQNTLLFLIVSSLFLFNIKVVILQFEYTFNNKTFTEKYCINKDKPELKCNGKCHLAKIAKENQKENAEKQFFLDIEITFFQNIEKTFAFFNPYLILKKTFWNCPDLYSLTTLTELDHPPQFSF